MGAESAQRHSSQQPVTARRPPGTQHPGHSRHYLPGLHAHHRHHHHRHREHLRRGLQHSASDAANNNQHDSSSGATASRHSHRLAVVNVLFLCRQRLLLNRREQP